MNPAHTSFADAAEPVYPVASLIDHHRRAARRWLHTAAAILWDITQPRHYTIAYQRTDQAHRREALACLLHLHRTGLHYLTSAWCHYQTEHHTGAGHGWD